MPITLYGPNPHHLLTAWLADAPKDGAAYEVMADGRIQRRGATAGAWYELTRPDPLMAPRVVVATRDGRPHAIAATRRGLAANSLTPSVEVAAGLANRRDVPDPMWCVEPVAFGDVVAQVAASLAGDDDWYATASFPPPPEPREPASGAGQAAAKHDNWLPRGPEAAFRAFLGTLDPAAVSALRAGLVPHVARQCWDGLDATFGHGGCLLAAILSLPALAGTLTSAWMRDPRAFASDMAHGDPWAAVRREAMRDGMPRWVAAALPEALARMPASERHGMPESRDVVRTEAARHGEACGLAVPPSRRMVTSSDRCLEPLRLLYPLPPDRLPRGDGWEAFAAATGFLHSVQYRTGPGRLDAALGMCGADWQGLVTALAGLHEDGNFVQAVHDAGDRADAYARQVVAPALRLAGTGIGPKRANLLSNLVLDSGRKLRSWVADSERWHARAGRIDAVLAALPGAERVDSPWLPCFPDLRVVDVDVRVLTSVAQLVAEGFAGDDRDGVAGLGHCVGGYGQRCRSGMSRVLGLSTTSPSGRRTRLSTVEVTFHPGGQWMVSQHRGARNREPPPEALGAWHAYLDRLARPGMVRPSDLAPVPEPNDHGAGYDVDVPGNWEAARAAWAPFVPRAARHLAPGDWVRVHEWCGPHGRYSWFPSRPW